MHFQAMDNQEQLKRWYVLRDFKKRNAKEPGYQLLSRLGIRNFTPLHWIVTTRGGVRKREYVPVIQGLLFAYETRDVLDPIIEKELALQYQFKRGAKSGTPMEVPEKEMNDFIEAVGHNASPIFYKPEELTSDKIGKKVRVIGGAFDGREANLLKMQGSKKKRLIFSVPDVISAAVEINADYFEFI